MSESAPAALVAATLTCHTDTCGNDGVPIVMQVIEGTGAALCGACGNPITDITTEGTNDD